ncbi:MAG: hypothetical protein O2887_15165 [Bacteroidetes bacterium]|nr:hypothetical protein [Bacteroidota bacterium]MDA1121804.1 hypothetical protein [Bacteroidota bacterium]
MEIFLKRFTSVFLIILFSSTLVCNGQDYVFKALLSKGQVEISKSGNGAAIPIKVGQELYDTDQIIMNDQPYLALMHNSGKTLEIKESGKYEVKDLSKEIPKGGEYVITRFLRFVSVRVNSVNEDVYYNYRENVTAVGGAERGADQFINLLVKDAKDIQKFHGSRITVRWLGSEIFDKYSIKISSAFGDPLTTYETTNEFLELNFDDPVFQNNRFVTLQIAAEQAGVVSPIYQFQKTNNQEQISALEGLLSNYDGGGLLDALMRAFIYEDQGFFIDALSEYERAILLSDEVDDLTQMRDCFIISNEMGK